MSRDVPEAALRFIAWSRLWSPLANDSERREAWEMLALPGHWEHHRSEFWNTFHIGDPAPPIPLVLHSALGREGSSVREDWMRVISHLRLKWNNAHLAPDQLGAACEVYACAIDSAEPVLVEELRRRYLLPWCEAARAKLAPENETISELPERFAEDLRAAVAA